MNSNDLLAIFYAYGLSEGQGMDLLQDQGVISDNCVWAKDVAEVDIPRAIEYIKKHHTNDR